ncbi:uncharacterized protein LOC127806909 isoform X5 [Diospyros lotus]|uniref:uncharacterized protein LOC127806909 isoform X5 n=1 Tax=Diospyros lotus TaxID=55363 RepID=UPI00224CC0DF|nr:uncharacterized protein LOC127806909 isoform X5 [Diospyros lotus]
MVEVQQLWTISLFLVKRMETYTEPFNFFKKETLMLLFAMSVTLMLFAFVRQRQRKKKRLSLLAKERKKYIMWIGWKNIWSLKGEIQLSCFDGDVIRLLCMFLIGDTYKLIRRFFGK